MSIFPTWQHRYTATRRLAITADAANYIKAKRIKVEAGLHYLDGNPRPHFSVTCSINEQAKNNRWVEAGGGADHEEILKAFPKLAPVVAVHLSDDHGVPMHAFANGLYFLGHSRYPDARNLDTFRSLLRVSEEEARDCDAHVNARDDKQAAIGEWAERIGLAARWQADADAAVVVLDELIAAQAANRVAGDVAATS